MKKTISMILVAVMLVLTLVSCGYSIAQEDIKNYATISEADKTKLKEALKTLVIEDGDFTADPATRDKKVEDTVYSALASAVSSDEKKTTGTPAGHDIVYYSYYCTAEFGSETVVLYAANMKSSSAVKLQLGQKDPSALNEKLSALFGVDFKDVAYSSKTSGSATKGSEAYVTYTYTYNEKGADGIDKAVTKTVTNGVVVIGDKAEEDATAASVDQAIAQALNGKTIGTSVDNFKVTVDKLGEVSFSGIKINWVAVGKELATVKNVTFDTSVKVNDTNGVSRDLKDVELTYHVYPVSYISVPEYDATNLMNIILGTKITPEAFYAIVFDFDFDEKTEEEQKAVLDKYVSKEDGKDVTLEALIKAIAELQTSVESAKKTLDSANDDLAEKQKSYDSAKKKYDDKVKSDGEDKATEEKKALDKADTALNGNNGQGGAKNIAKEAQTKYDEKVAARDQKLETLFALGDGKMKDMITDGYKAFTRHALLDSYNAEIKNNLAKEIYYYIQQYVKVTGVPEKAVDETYDQLIQNYKNDFYTGTYDSSKKISNYKQYNGDFKAFFIAKVTADIKTVKTYEDACKELREYAKTKYVEPVVVIYAASEAFGVLATEKEYKEYIKDTDNNYSYNEHTYGANSVRYAYQFDKLINSFLVEKDPDEEGNTTYDKSIIDYTFGTPASAGKTETESAEQ